MDNGQIHYKLPICIATLNYQRVNHLTSLVAQLLQRSRKSRYRSNPTVVQCVWPSKCRNLPSQTFFLILKCQMLDSANWTLLESNLIHMIVLVSIPILVVKKIWIAIPLVQRWPPPVTSSDWNWITAPRPAAVSADPDTKAPSQQPASDPCLRVHHRNA